MSHDCDWFHAAATLVIDYLAHCWHSLTGKLDVSMYLRSIVIMPMVIHARMAMPRMQHVQHMSCWGYRQTYT